mgnify:CR=1 FL=1
MSKYQFYSPLDPLSDFKKEKSLLYRNCDFYENFQNGVITSLRSGYIEESPVLETVITDGHISIEGMAREKGFIIVRNTLFGLDNSKVVNIIIDDASFMVSSLLIDGKRINDIHVNAGSITLYNRILNYLYNGGSLEVEKISFKEPTLVEYSSPDKREFLDLKTGKTKRKK